MDQDYLKVFMKKYFVINGQRREFLSNDSKEFR